MAYTTTDYKHVLLDGDRVATIAGTTMKVAELVTSHLTYGWSPEELHFQYPHVSLGKIYSALAYYWDFKETLDEEMAGRFQRAESLRRQAPDSRIVEKLRKRGAIARPRTSTTIAKVCDAEDCCDRVQYLPL